MRLNKNFSLLLLAVTFSLTSCSQLPSSQSDTASISPPPVQSIAKQQIIKPKPLAPVSVPDLALKPVPVLDLWERVQDNYNLDLSVENSRIKVQRDWYIKNQDYMERVSNRASRYLYNIVEQLEAREMPGELALLPIVESAFDPFAYSHGRASGMWQFIPGTGTRFGLTQDWWYDGRRDVVESTRAALDYLEYLYNEFDQDWLHALAAYNSGEGNVSKAIKANLKAGKPTDFWSLNLPRETKAYVPKLLALAQLLANQQQYGLEFPSISKQPYFASVDTGGQIDLSLAASLAEIDLDELYLLNPGYNQWATSPDGPHYLNVPIEQADKFATELANLPGNERVSWIRYTIKNGDSLIKIANNHNTTVETLKTANKLSSNRIRAGKTLLIPTALESDSTYVLSAASRLSAKQEQPANTGKTRITHKVANGESFWTISRKYGVAMRDLASWNGLATRDTLKVGQELVVWQTPKVTATTTTSTTTRSIIRKIGYSVRNGDSLARIADRFSVTIADIENWNEISRSKYLQPGQQLTLYVDVTQASL